MVISCSTFQKEEKECIWVKYLIYAVLLSFQIGGHLRVFSPANLYSQIFQVHKKMFFFKLALVMQHHLMAKNNKLFCTYS